MNRIFLFVLLILLIMGCKTTGIHIIDNPDGTSVKVYYWSGNSMDNQGDVIQIGKHGNLMKIEHNVTFIVISKSLTY